MLIWVNGTFGVGKTQTAFELHQRLPGSVVVDPEQIGYAMRRISPAGIWPDDFQSLPQWRAAVRAHLSWIGRSFQGVAIVPMTLLEPEWHEEIVGALSSTGVRMLHFTLTADERTIRARLARRGDAGNRWALERLRRYQNTMHLPQFAQQIDTVQLDIAGVASRIAAAAGLEIAPQQHPLRARWRRLATWARHIRLGG